LGARSYGAFCGNRWGIGTQTDELFQVLNGCCEQKLIFGTGEMLIPREAAHPFRDDVAPLFRNIVAP
jgi:hypothetical protein